jgi:peptidoglycan hydrolase CwlO-like protein
MTDEELKELVASLAIAQKKTDEQMNRTEQQMRHTDEKIAQLQESIKETNASLKRVGVDFGNMKEKSRFCC